MTTKNLGWIKSIKRGSTPPTNLEMLWYDTNLTGAGSKVKYYDLVLSVWKLFTDFTNTPFFLAGSISSSSDFPALGEVENGFVYVVRADVTDDDPTKTNTGDSFRTGQEIFWINGAWEEYGNSTQADFDQTDPVEPSYIRNKPVAGRESLTTVESIITIADQGTIDYFVEVVSYVTSAGNNAKDLVTIDQQTSTTFRATTVAGHEAGTFIFRILKF